MALHSFFFLLWARFQFLNPIHSRYGSLDGRSARRKAAAYTQNKRTQASMPRDIFFDFGRVFSVLVLYTVGRATWIGDQPVGRPLPTHRINARRRPCLEWDWNPRSQRSSERKQFMP
jgi:hypothetical protein